MDTELENIRFTVVIQEVNLTVRFPCSLIFQIKADNKTVDGIKSYELVGGVCKCDNALQIDTEVQKDATGNYMDKNIKIVVIMCSANGKIPAGSVTVPFRQEMIKQEVYDSSAIEKCPDRTASLKYCVSAESLGKVPVIDSSVLSRLTEEKRMEKNEGSRASSRNSHSFIYRSHDHKNSTRMNYDSRKYLMKSNPRQFDDQENMSNRSQALSYNSDSVSRRVLQLERQKTDNDRQLSKLRNQLLAERSPQLLAGSNRLRNEIDHIAEENEKLREKLRKSEHRQHQLSQSLKEMKQELARKQEKSHEQQFKKLELQQTVQGKERAIKQLRHQLKKQEQELNDVRILLNAQQKRNEYKESSHKQQLKRLDEKYQQAEQLRQKSVLNVNQMLEDMQQTEKKNQQTIRQKQKASSEQRLKLLRKTDELSRVIAQQKDKLEEQENSNHELSRQNTQLLAKVNELEKSINEKQEQLKDCHMKLGKEQETNRNLQRALEDSSATHLQLKKVKKQFEQSHSQQAQNAKQLESLTKQCQQQKLKNNELQHQVADKSEQLRVCTVKVLNLNSQIQSLKQIQQQTARQQQSLQLSNLNLGNQVQQLKQQLQVLMSNYKNLESEGEQQISYLLKNRQHMQLQIEQLKCSVQKYEDMHDSCLRKNKNLNNQVLALNKKIMELEDQVNRSEELIEDYQSKQRMLTEDTNKLQCKDKELADKLRTRNQEIHQLNKKVNKSETSEFMLREKNKHLEKQCQEAQAEAELAHKQHEKRINELESALKARTTQLNSKEQLLFQYQNDVSRLEEAVTHLKSSESMLVQESSQNCVNLQAIKTSLTEQEAKVRQLGVQLDQQKEKAAACESKYTKIKKQYHSFKEDNFKAIQNFLTEISKGLSIKQHAQVSTPRTKQTNLLLFPDDRISGLQIESLRKRNTIVQRNQEAFNQLSQQVKIQQQEITKLKQHHEEYQQESQQVLAQQKMKLKSLLSDSSLEKSELINKIQTLNEKVHGLSTEKDRMRLELEDKTRCLAEKEQELQESIFNNESLLQQKKSLQSIIQQYDLQNSKAKSQYENQLITKSSQTILAQEKMRKSISELNNKVQRLERSSYDKDQQIQSFEAEVRRLTEQRDALTVQNQDHRSTILELTQQMKQQAETNHYRLEQITKLQSNLEQLNSQNRTQAFKLEQIGRVNKQLQSKCQQSLRTIKKLESELSSNSLYVCELQQNRQSVNSENTQALNETLKESKQLRQQIIALNSELQLKSFMIEHQQATIANNKATVSQLEQENANKKSEILTLNNKLNQEKSANIELEQNLDMEREEKQQLREEVIMQKQTIASLEYAMAEGPNQDAVEYKDKQIARLKQQLQTVRETTQTNISQLKKQITEGKQQQLQQATKQQQLLRKIRQLQKQLGHKNYDIEVGKHQEKTNEQIRNLQNQIDQLVSQNNDLVVQINNANAQISNLTGMNYEKQGALKQYDGQGQNLQEQVASLKQEVRQITEAWERQKNMYISTKQLYESCESQFTKAQQDMLELQNNNRKLIQIAKQRIAEQIKPSLGEILREINSLLIATKTKIIGKHTHDKDKNTVIAEFRLVQDKIDSAIRSHHLIVK